MPRAWAERQQRSSPISPHAHRPVTAHEAKRSPAANAGFGTARLRPGTPDARLAAFPPTIRILTAMDHWQRIAATLAGESADRVPVALWRHFPEDDQDPSRLVERTLAWQACWDFDLVKFMPSGTYGVEDWGAVSAWTGQANGARVVVDPAVKRTHDWLALRDVDVRTGCYGRQNEALRETARRLGGRVPILQTVFSPLTTARKLATERLFADLRRAPEAVHHALRLITDVTIRFARDALDAGAHGVFLATQLASDRLLTRAEYEEFGKRYDLQLLDGIAGKARLSMLHLHGDDIMFDLVADYPVEMLNWHDQITEPPLREAAGRFRGIVVGGLNENGALAGGNAAGVAAEVRDAIAQTGGRRLMIGPGCVVPIASPDAAIAAALAATGARRERVGSA
jgi:uroporphyrinogen decarboxylase